MAVPGAIARYTYLRGLAQNPELLSPVDTFLHGVYRFDSTYLRNLGSEGTPTFDLMWNPFVKPGFRLGFDQWDAYRLTHAKTRYFNTQNPYSNLFFVQGAHKLQKLEVLHTQNILPNWNGAIHLNRQGAGGWYGNRSTSFSNLGINTWYRSPGRRYMAVGSALFNGIKAEENGGIRNLIMFDTVAASDRQRIETWLPDARQRWKDQDFYIQQFLYFGPRAEHKINDTLTAPLLKPRFYLSHAINYTTYRYTYTDKEPDSLFYPTLFYDTEEIRDEYLERKLVNRAAIGFNLPDTTRQKVFFIQGYAEHEMAAIALKDEAYNFGDNTRLGFDATASGKAAISASGYTYLTGYNAGDYGLQGTVKSPFVRVLGITHIYGTGGAQGYSPTIIQRRFLSGQALWTTNLRPTHAVQVGGGFSGIGRSRLEAVYQIADGFIYHGKDLVPVQADTAIHYLRFTLKKRFDLGDFHFDHDISYQKVLRGDGIRVPGLIWRSSYYFETRLWRVMLFQAGIDLNYNSVYYPFAYRPGLSDFYRQDSMKAGGYPVVDVWLAGQVKRFHFFAKMEHANFGLTGSNYFLVPAYPLYPRTYRVGIRWWFYN